MSASKLSRSKSRSTSGKASSPLDVSDMPLLMLEGLFYLRQIANQNPNRPLKLEEILEHAQEADRLLSPLVEGVTHLLMQLPEVEWPTPEQSARIQQILGLEGRAA